MNNVGIIGWRGMVGSVLLERMLAEQDFDVVSPTFFSTSKVGGASPDIGRSLGPVQDANDIAALAKLPMLISTQGGEYTEAMHPRLRAAGWDGYWIDAASPLRMNKNAVIVLDPVNLAVMEAARRRGVRDFIGGNCTVSLMLMAVAGLLRAGVVEWITAMTYQSASGAGAQHMRELLEQMGALYRSASSVLHDPVAGILEVDRAVRSAQKSADFPTAQFGVPLAANLIPWIDKDLGNGQSREEWKAGAEANKIMGTEEQPVPVEGICVRVSAMRCHSQALTIKLKKGPTLGGNREVDRGRQRLGARGAQRSRVLDSPALPAGGQRAHGNTDRPPAKAGHGRGIPVRVHRRRSAPVGRGGAFAAGHAISASARK
jgi:aspartate-semialdehyde dehydrogenase